MMTDLIEAAIVRFQSAERLYMGQLESCTHVQHAGLVPRGDEVYEPTFLEDVLNRKDATCYPPYMKGLGYVLSFQLVREIATMSRHSSLRIYANEDIMLGTWLHGHDVHRARLVAKEYLDMWCDGNGSNPS